jgi:hypothetical protein
MITHLYTLQHLKTKTKTQHKKLNKPANSDIYEQKCTTLDTDSKHKQKLVLCSPCREDFQNTKQINKINLIKHFQNKQKVYKLINKNQPIERNPKIM